MDSSLAFTNSTISTTSETANSSTINTPTKTTPTSPQTVLADNAKQTVSTVANRWCMVNKDNFPIVKVCFNSRIQTEEEFEYFINEWVKLYEDKKDFYFIFDTRRIGMINMKYTYRISKFIKELKRRDVQYLKKSIIIVKNKPIQLLLNIVFGITKPVAPVYLFSNNDPVVADDIDNIKTEYDFTNVITDYTSKFSVIKSK